MTPARGLYAFSFQEAKRVFDQYGKRTNFLGQILRRSLAANHSKFSALLPCLTTRKINSITASWADVLLFFNRHRKISGCNNGMIAVFGGVVAASITFSGYYGGLCKQLDPTSIVFI